MAQRTTQYKDIHDTIQGIKTQIIDGVNYGMTCPRFNDPRELWDWLKARITYENDPKDRELLQCLPTLLTEANEHGTPGLGDCDCFSIAAVTLMICQNWDGINIVLAGRSKKAPVHIYTEIIWNGEPIILDFTNKKYNYERYYPYTQRLPVGWRNW